MNDELVLTDDVRHSGHGRRGMGAYHLLLVVLVMFVLWGPHWRRITPPQPSSSLSFTQKSFNNNNHNNNKSTSRDRLLEDPPSRLNISYQPSESEAYLMQHAVEWRYDRTRKEELPETCDFWKNKSMTPFHESLNQYRRELDYYKQLIDNFTLDVPDLRHELGQGKSHAEVCAKVELHANGLDGIFASRQLSYGPFGKIEPLLPPLRHPQYCFEGRDPRLMDLGYMVHDFGALCRQLTSHSRIVLLDMGASLAYGGSWSPAFYLTAMYRKFGFPFDHILAFEINHMDPDFVVRKLPEELIPFYHWINVGVSADPNSRVNPWKLLRTSFTDEDIVVVKLDIDTPSVEIPLFMQLLEDPRMHTLVDQFYFEHHVVLKDLLPEWKWRVDGSVKYSLDLFRALREKGVAAHSWV